MHLFSILRILGILLVLFSVTMLPPLAVAFLYQDSGRYPFFLAYVLTLGIGLLLWIPSKNRVAQVSVRDGFLIVALIWLVLGLFGALPFYFSTDPHMSITDAAFESMSGLTTTGATVILGIDELPKSILYYRQQLHGLGGMGIIVLAVAVLPMLGIGGMQLFRTEIAGPVKNARLTARIAETAKSLWYTYLGLTVACAFAYWLAGMDLFDAVGHAYSTIGTGGFSTHDASIAWFDSLWIESIAVFFMFLSGVNFALHFFSLREMSLRPYRGNAEFKAYAMLMGGVSLICVFFLYAGGAADGFLQALRLGIFQAVSIGTSTGLTTASYHLWPGMLPILLLLTSFVGGCAGSTAGGMKVVRVLLLFRLGLREIALLVHPKAMIAVRIGNDVVPNRVVEAIWGFFAVYVASFVAIYLMLAAVEPDLVTAFSAVAACMNNMGVGLGQVGSTFAGVSDFGKWVLFFAMLIGRLEVFTVLVLFLPMYWRN